MTHLPAEMEHIRTPWLEIFWGLVQSGLFSSDAVGALRAVYVDKNSGCFSMEADIVFYFKPTAMCCENLTCFVDYVQTLSCILRNDLSASSYNLTATWYVLVGWGSRNF